MAATPQDFTEHFDRAFEDLPIMVILRGLAPGRTVEFASRAWDLGITQVEVPIHVPEQVPSLVAAVQEGQRRDRPVGAGSVFTARQVRVAVDAGAAYTVSPGMAGDVIDESLRLGVPHLPGVATPSDVIAAQRRGLTWVKAFPASHLGPSWVRSILGPFPHLRITVTGGVDATNAMDFLEAGARVAGVGSALADPQELARLIHLVRDRSRRASPRESD